MNDYDYSDGFVDDKQYRDPREDSRRNWRRHAFRRLMGLFKGFDGTTNKPILRVNEYDDEGVYVPGGLLGGGIVNDDVPDYHAHGSDCGICRDSGIESKRQSVRQQARGFLRMNTARNNGDIDPDYIQDEIGAFIEREKRL